MNKVIPYDAILIPDMAKKVFEGQIFDVYQWQQPLFDGTQHTFEMLRRADTVSAICVVDDKIMLIDDEQPHLGRRQSFPGGRVDPEDSGVTYAAQREIIEETGYSFHNWRLVKVWQPYRKMEWFVYLFIAWEVADRGEPKPDPGEKINLQMVDFSEAKDRVMQRIGYLGENIDIFEQVESIEQLLELPEFDGQTIEH